MAILRIAVPYTGMILSTRESPAMRDALLAVGMSQVGVVKDPKRVDGEHLYKPSRYIWDVQQTCCLCGHVWVLCMHHTLSLSCMHRPIHHVFTHLLYPAPPYATLLYLTLPLPCLTLPCPTLPSNPR